MKRLKILLVLLIVFCFFSGCVNSIDSLISKNLERLTLENPYMRKQAVAALGGTGDVRVVIPIARLLTDPDNGVLEQVYTELDHLRQLDIPVNEEIIRALAGSEREFRISAVQYLAKMHQRGMNIQETTLKVLLGVDNDFIDYRELLVYLHTRVNSTLQPELLERLTGDNGVKAAQLLLLLDSCGYSIDTALVDELISQGMSLSEVTGQLLAQYACRQSNIQIDNSDNQLQVMLHNDVIVIDDKSSLNQQRCLTGDTLWAQTPENISWIGRLALLKQQSTSPSTVKTLYEELMISDKDNVIATLISDMDSSRKSDERHDSLINCLTEDDIVREVIRKDLKPEETLAVLASDEENTETPKGQAILIVNNTDGNLIDYYHWYLPIAWRPETQSEIRYVVSIPKETGVLSVVDRHNQVLVLEKEINQDEDIKAIIDDLIEQLMDN